MYLVAGFLFYLNSAMLGLSEPILHYFCQEMHCREQGFTNQTSPRVKGQTNGDKIVLKVDFTLTHKTLKSDWKLCTALNPLLLLHKWILLSSQKVKLLGKEFWLGMLNFKWTAGIFLTKLPENPCHSEATQTFLGHLFAFLKWISYVLASLLFFLWLHELQRYSLK